MKAHILTSDTYLAGANRIIKNKDKAMRVWRSILRKNGVPMGEIKSFCGDEGEGWCAYWDESAYYLYENVEIE